MKGDRVWWEAEEGQVHKLLLPYVQEIDQRQIDHVDRFALLDALYDPNGQAAQQADAKWRAEIGRMTENVIASNVDTVRSAVATTEVRARFLTDGASWSAARRATLMERYVEELGKLLDVAEACRVAFFDCALKGTGVVKVYADQDDQICVEPVMIDNIVVDDGECANGASPRQMHYRQVDCDRDVLIHQFPERETEILRAKGSSSWRQTLARWRSPLSNNRNDVAVVESWRLPMGTPESDNYRPGRHVICVEGCDLLDEEWGKAFFPFASMRWGLRRSSWYGISLAERIIGHQRVLNKRGWHMERVLDRLAVPTTFVSVADQNLRVQSHAIGNVVALKGAPPQTIVPSVIGPELQADRAYAKNSAFEETGVSRMAATSSKPAGLDSGVALREWRDMGTDRFSLQEKGFERLYLDVVMLILDACKDLGPNAPRMSKRSRWAPRKIGWKDVDLSDLRVQISASSTIPRTSAGREQAVMEFTQAGIFTLDEARSLLKHPDVDKTLSLYTSVREAIEEDLEGIELGFPVAPEPFLNLELASRLAHARYLVDRQYDDIPEEVLEGIRTYIVQTQHMISMAAAPAAGPAGPMGPEGGMAEPPAPTPQQVPAMGPSAIPAEMPPMAA